MKQCFAYIRVSSAKQEEQGASLGEQRSAILRYAEKQGLEIVEWFEEVETAAKRGRPVFTKVVKLIRAGKAQGLVMHKIDRSTRNYYDWAEISDLADRGISVHYANENLELGTRGRRLMADIQAVFAADYIRNLREEVHKGIDGRLREGLITWAAPVGYVDNGRGGKKKTICPIKGPLVREAFQLYASGHYTLRTLCDELHQRGLRNTRGGRITKSGLSMLLNNPFYIGLIAHRKIGGPVHKGVHEPLISKALFDQVQRRLQGKVQQKVKRHSFIYRRMFRCTHCNHFLTPERQKGHVYYRCHTRGCARPCVREEAVEQAIIGAVSSLSYPQHDRERLLAYAENLLHDHDKHIEEVREVWRCQLGAIQARQDRLVDAYLEGTLDKETFEDRKRTLLLEKIGLEGQLAQDQSQAKVKERLLAIFELAFSASLGHEMGSDEEKREQVELLTSNRAVDDKNVIVGLSLPFCFLALDRGVLSGAPSRTRSRSRQKMARKPRSRSARALRHIVQEIYDWLKEHPKDASE